MPRPAGTWLDTGFKGRRSKFVRFIEWVGGQESEEQLQIQRKTLGYSSHSKHGRGTRGWPPRPWPCKGAVCCHDSEPAEVDPNPQSQRFSSDLFVQREQSFHDALSRQQGGAVVRLHLGTTSPFFAPLVSTNNTKRIWVKNIHSKPRCQVILRVTDS